MVPIESTVSFYGEVHVVISFVSSHVHTRSFELMICDSRKLIKATSFAEDCEGLTVAGGETDLTCVGNIGKQVDELVFSWPRYSKAIRKMTLSW
jgi:hypothetical protein